MIRFEGTGFVPPLLSTRGALSCLGAVRCETGAARSAGFMASPAGGAAALDLK